MWFINRIADAINGIYKALIYSYEEISGWIWPFNLIAPYLLDATWWVGGLYFRILNLGDWIEDTTDKLASLFTELDLEQWLAEWIEKILDAWDWVRSAGRNVTDIVGDWWRSTQNTVKSWIDIATQGFDDLKVAWDSFWKVTWPKWTTELLRVSSDLSTFIAYVLPRLLDISVLTDWWNDRVADIQGLINTAFTLRQSFWEGWQELRGLVIEFFTDPLDWLENKFTDWFLGAE